MNNKLLLVISILLIFFLISLNSPALLTISIFISIGIIGLLVNQQKKVEVILFLLVIYVFSIFVYNKNNKTKQFQELFSLQTKKKIIEQYQSPQSSPAAYNTNSDLILTGGNYKEIDFVLRALLDNNYYSTNTANIKEVIDSIMIEYNITDVYKLIHMIDPSSEPPVSLLSSIPTDATDNTIYSSCPSVVSETAPVPVPVHSHTTSSSCPIPVPEPVHSHN